MHQSHITVQGNEIGLKTIQKILDHPSNQNVLNSLVKQPVYKYYRLMDLEIVIVEKKNA